MAIDKFFHITWMVAACLSILVTLLFIYFRVFSFVDLEALEEKVRESEDKVIRVAKKKERRRDLSDFFVTLGKNKEGKPVTIDINAFPHTFIAGQTGYGKTNLLLKIILSALAKKAGVDLCIFGISKSVPDFQIFSRIKAKCGFSTTEWEKILNYLEEELKKRALLLGKTSHADFEVKDIITYNKKVDEKLPYIMVIADEVQELAKLKKGKSVLTEIAQKGRSLGIFLFLATQNMNREKLGGDILANSSSRIALHVADAKFSTYFIGEKGAEKLKFGEAILLQEGVRTIFNVNETKKQAIKRLINSQSN